MRVLHLPTAVGGNAWGLAQGEKQLGIHSDVLVESQGPFGYPADIDLELEEVASAGKRMLHKLIAFLKVRGQYDVFHFNYGRTLLHQERYSVPFCHLMDLPFYPKKAKLFVTYNGCDARQKFPTIQRTPIAACHQPNCYGGMCASGRLDEVRRQSIAKMSRYVDHMWALNPDLLYFLPRDKASFLPYTVSQSQQGGGEGAVDMPDFERKKLQILHAPTNREAKGSEYILAALDRLQRRYSPDTVEVVLVENLPHQEALKRYREADLIVDQVLVGWYGGVAVENMLMGKPVIARIAEEDLAFIPSKMASDLRETVIHADPQDLDEVLQRCVEDRGYLRRRSEASMEYARRWHDPRYVAGLTKERYEG